jgi:sortase (surface protein transpeptidase)
MQQVLNDHSRIVQMMSQIMTSTSNDLPQSDHVVKKPRGDAEITLLACKIYGEIGHTSKEM